METLKKQQMYWNICDVEEEVSLMFLDPRDFQARERMQTWGFR
jgi:hypothetical protein